jgi:phosphatidylserine decarboxylase
MSHSHANQEAEKAARERAAIECSYRSGNISVIKYAGGVSSKIDIENAIKFLQVLLQAEDNHEK